MLIKAHDAARALAKPDPATRLYVFAGPDAAGSQALADMLARALGSDAERVDIAPGRLKDDPALLADEAAAISLFGGKRWISITLTSGGGDDVMVAADNLLSAPAAGNPVVVVGHALTAKSKLTKLAETHPLGMTVISYPPEGVAADRLAESLAAAHGLTLERGVAQALVAATGADRGLMAREVEKLALYCDATPDQPQRAGMEAWAAIGAGIEEEDVGAAVNIILDGKLVELPTLLATLAATGASDIRLIRAIATRAHLIARLRSLVDGGQGAAQVMEGAGKALFFKERPAVAAQMRRWDSPRIARLIDRLHGLERSLKAPNNAGGVLFRQGLLDMTRVAASLNRH
jgi:DNA polymerase III subunit delta